MWIPLPQKQGSDKASVSFDIPDGVIVWSRFPKLYNVDMANGRIRISHDKLKGIYTIYFLSVTQDAGVETEQEIDHLTFTSKDELLKFKNNFLKAFKEQGL